jgi:hypothetical protein
MPVVMIMSALCAGSNAWTYVVETCAIIHMADHALKISHEFTSIIFISNPLVIAICHSALLFAAGSE